MLALLLAVAFGPPPDTNCIWNRSTQSGRGVIQIADARRVSPRDSLTFNAGGAIVKVCYSRPSSRGRTMIGGENVPYGRLWRTGANEATMIHTTGQLIIAGIHVDAGTYSLYTVPAEREWEVVVNRSYMQWGEESNYTDSVRAQEVGRGRVPVTRVDQSIEQFTMRVEPGQDGDASLILEWEHSRIAIPFQRMR